MTPNASPSPRGRGSHIQPPNRFETTRFEFDLDQLEPDDELFDRLGKPETLYLPDKSRTVVSENDSPDIPFRFSVNPYRGCAHGCSYCYARPTHEYLGYSAGLDFETKILVKHDAPALLREFLARPSWNPETIVFSGVTDCYQPAEREFRLTRGCLEVSAEARQPVGLITKNALILRDLDLLRELAEHRAVRVSISLTTLDQSLAREMEPRTSAPAARLRTIRGLTSAGIPVNVIVAPVIPGLTDVELPSILSAAAEAGASSATYLVARLPLAVRPVFFEWLERVRPERRNKVENAIRSMKEGALNRSEFGMRFHTSGPLAEQIRKLFSIYAKRLGLDKPVAPLSSEAFRSPRGSDGQGRLF